MIETETDRPPRKRFTHARLGYTQWVVVDTWNAGEKVWPPKFECSFSRHTAKRIARIFNKQGGVLCK